uniref:Dymeclin n=1 Tax=Lygus hesperus TaxID=30085 RepID=A0A0A9YQA1_LYGHE
MFPLYDVQRVQQLQHSEYLGASITSTFDTCTNATTDYGTNKVSRYLVDVEHNCLLVELKGDGWNQVSHDIVVPGIGWISTVGVGTMRFRILVPATIDATTVHTYIQVRDPIIHKNTRRYLQRYTGTPVASPPHRLVSNKQTKIPTPPPPQIGEQASQDERYEEVFFEQGDEDIFTQEERERLLSMHRQQIQGADTREILNLVK